MANLRGVLEEVLGDRAARYTEDDIAALVASGYTDKAALKSASFKGLREAGLVPGKIDELLDKFSGKTAAGLEVHVLEPVTLDVKGADAPLKLPCDLYRKKLNVPQVEKLLDTYQLQLRLISGKGPLYDEQGYTLQTFKEGDTISIDVVKKRAAKVATATAYAAAHPWWQRLISG